ncbi:MAG: oligosaccharide flippase family protein [Spirochaetota bacterium]
MLDKLKAILFPDPKEDNLKKKSIASSLWALLGKGGGNVLRLGSNLALTSLLLPEAFGLMATASVFLAMLQLFSDFGIKTAIVQNPNGDKEEFLNAAWFISIWRGIVLFLIAVVFAYPLSLFYERNELFPLVLIVSSGILILGFENPAMTLLVKRMQTQRQILLDLGTEVLAITTTIVLAVVFANVWALAIGSVSLYLYKVLVSYLFFKYRPRFVWSQAYGKEILQFGKFILLNTAVTWASMNLDSLAIGKVLGMKSLGFYNIGKNLGLIVELLFIQMFSNAYFPAISSIAHQPERVEKAYLKYTRVVIAISVPLLTCIAVSAEFIVSTLYNPKYLTACIVLFWIAFRGILRILNVIQGTTLVAAGKPKYESFAMSISLLVLFPCFFLGISQGAELTKVLYQYFPFSIYNEKLFGVSTGVFLASVPVLLVEILLLKKIMGFHWQTIFVPWLQILVLVFLILTVYFYLPMLIAKQLFFGFAFPIALGIISLLISAAIYYILVKYQRKALL